MWANAQRDGRPAEYRWRPLFSAAKFGWCPILDCRAVTLPRRETRWNLLACPKLPDRSQPLVGRSSPYYQDMWRRYFCLTSFPHCRYVPYLCGSMANIQSPAAEIRQGKKKEEEHTTGWKYIWPALLHRAAINNHGFLCFCCAHYVQNYRLF